jgi:hypothetical protein
MVPDRMRVLCLNVVTDFCDPPQRRQYMALFDQAAAPGSEEMLPCPWCFGRSERIARLLPVVANSVQTNSAFRCIACGHRMDVPDQPLPGFTGGA